MSLQKIRFELNKSRRMQFQPFIVGQEIGLGPDSGPIGLPGSAPPPPIPLLIGISSPIRANIGWTSGEFDWPFTPPTFKTINTDDSILLCFGYEGGITGISVSDDVGNTYSTIGDETGSALPGALSFIYAQLSNGVPSVLHITPSGSFTSPNYFSGAAVFLSGPSGYILSSTINPKEVLSGDIISDLLDGSGSKNVAICGIIGGDITPQPPQLIFNQGSGPIGIFAGGLQAGLASETTSAGHQIISEVYVSEVDAVIIGGQLHLLGSYFGLNPSGSPVECLTVILSLSH